MFYELIHTRCKQGVDIKQGKAVTSEGFKEYAYSPELLKDGVVDMPFFAEAVKGTSSYVDKADANKFMEDAYLYYVPDVGVSFMVNFHPIPWEKDFESQGKFMNRPGNFVNHVFAGDFGQAGFYPYELFGDAAWDAKDKGYSYYYDNPPTDLNMRNLKPTGKYTHTVISAFIADGRSELLVKAVAFLIAQFTKDPKERKYLVIKDINSENIEKWIAAIQSAFSPRIAAGLPFATRMDKFASLNRYTVNQEGRFQAQMNLQDPRQIHKFRAMIVGVDERDRNNVNAAKPMANSPFVLLEGKEKKADFEVGSTNHNYFKLITSFDSTHKEFCREFLQTFHETMPTENMMNLFDAFKALGNIDTQSASSLLRALDILSKFKADNTDSLQTICHRLEKSLSTLLQSDLINTLGIIDWLQKSSAITRDTGFKSRMVDMVTRSFEDLVFIKGRMNDAAKFWQQLKNGEFARDIAVVMTDKNNLSKMDASLELMKPSEWIIFLDLYLECGKVSGATSSDIIIKIGGLCLYSCYREKDKKSTADAIDMLSQDRFVSTTDLLFSIAKDMSDDDFAQYLIGYIIENDNSIIISDNAMLAFCYKLINADLEQLIGFIVKNRLVKLRMQEYPQYIKVLDEFHRKDYLGDKDLTDVLVAMDEKIQPEAPDKAMQELTNALINHKLRLGEYVNAAHVYAISEFSRKTAPQNFGEIVEYLDSNGFPSCNKKAYIDKFIKYIASMQIGKRDQYSMLNLLCKKPSIYLFAYAMELISNIKKHREKWIVLMEYIGKLGDQGINDIIKKALMNTKQNKKTITELFHALPDNIGDYFWEYIVADVLEVLNPKKVRKSVADKGSRTTPASKGKEFGDSRAEPRGRGDESEHKAKRGLFSGLFSGGKKK